MQNVLAFRYLKTVQTSKTGVALRIIVSICITLLHVLNTLTMISKRINTMNDEGIYI